MDTVTKRTQSSGSVSYLATDNAFCLNAWMRRCLETNLLGPLWVIPSISKSSRPISQKPRSVWSEPVSLVTHHHLSLCRWYCVGCQLLTRPELPGEWCSTPSRRHCRNAGGCRRSNPWRRRVLGGRSHSGKTATAYQSLKARLQQVPSSLLPICNNFSSSFTGKSFSLNVCDVVMNVWPMVYSVSGYAVQFFP